MPSEDEIAFGLFGIIFGGVGGSLLTLVVQRFWKDQDEQQQMRNLAFTVANDIRNQAGVAIHKCKIANNWVAGGHMLFQHLRNLRPSSLDIYRENSSKLIILGPEKANAIDAFYRELDSINGTIDRLDDPSKGDGNINSGQTQGVIKSWQRACVLAVDAIEMIEPLARDVMQANGRTLDELKQTLRRVAEGEKLNT